MSVAEGVVYLSMCASSAIARRWPFALGRLTVEGGRIGALFIFLPMVFYCSSIQAVLLFGYKVRLPHIEEDIRWLLAVPGMPTLIGLHTRAATGDG